MDVYMMCDQPAYVIWDIPKFTLMKLSRREWVNKNKAKNLKQINGQTRGVGKNIALFNYFH